MMKRRVWKPLALAFAVLPAGACIDSPIDPTDEGVAELIPSQSYLVIDAGESRPVDVTPVNAAQQAVLTEIDFEVCDAKIALSEDTTRTPLNPGSGVLVTGQTLGETCINYSGGGEEGTITVRVVPAALALEGPELVGSGETGTLTVTFLSESGGAATGFDLDEVTFTSLTPAIASVDETGTVSGRTPGTAQIEVALNEGLGEPRADTISFEVAPGGFTGSLSTTAAAPGEEVTITRGATAAAWDDDVTITIGGVTTYWFATRSDADVLVTRVPSGVEPGDYEIIVANIGEDQVAVAADFTVEAGAVDPEEPNDYPSVTAESLPVEVVSFVSDADINDFYEITLTAETTLEGELDWNTGEDLDFIIADPTLSSFPCFAASTAHPEHFEDCVLPAGTWLLWVNNYSGAAPATTYHLHVAVQEE